MPYFYRERQLRVIYCKEQSSVENWMNSYHLTNKCSAISSLWNLSLRWNRGALLIIERGGAGLQCGVKRLSFNERARKRICSHKRRGKEKDAEKEREREKRKEAPRGVGNHLDRSWPENWHGPIIIGYSDVFQTHLMSRLWWKLPRSLTSHKHCWHCWALVIWKSQGKDA